MVPIFIKYIYLIISIFLLICGIFVYSNRGTCAKFKGTITINPDHDVAGVIHAMNIGFQLAAKRFARDRNHQVYAYGRRGFSY